MELFTDLASRHMGTSGDRDSDAAGTSLASTYARVLGTAGYRHQKEDCRWL